MEYEFCFSVLQVFFLFFLLLHEKRLQNYQIIYDMTFASKLIHAVEYTRL